MAAAVVDAIEKDLTEPTEGKQKVLRYLSRARSERFFNPNAVHVQANLIKKLAKKLGDAHRADLFQLANHVLQELDSTLFVMSTDSDRTPIQRQDVKILEDARGDVLVAVSTVDDLTRAAEALWDEHESQEGIVLAGRKAFADARAAGTGTKFREAFDYVDGWIKRSIRAIVRRRCHSSALRSASTTRGESKMSNQGQAHSRRSAIKLEALSKAVLGLLISQQPAPEAEYIFGLANAHQGKWKVAQATFDSLKRKPLPQIYLASARDWLLTKDGSRRRVQERPACRYGDVLQLPRARSRPPDVTSR